ncbi:MAG: glycosyltransferase family 2 protein [Nitrospirae bacterium]|nr:glycosyltransferase family 2 protein [Nitrospirota bacterium]
MLPDISIIIVNYHTADFVHRCVGSILNSSNDSVEIIVVDNSSTPSEAERLVALTDAGVKLVFNQDNPGFACACNQGVSLANGHYVMFLNPDTIVFEGCLLRLVDFFNTGKNVGAVGPKTWWDSAKTLQLVQHRLPSPCLRIRQSLSDLRYLNSVIDRANLAEDYAYQSAITPLSVDMLPGSAILTSKSIIKRVGLFDEGYPLYFEDSDWCKRLKRSGLDLYMVPDAQICHFYNQSARTDSGISFGKFVVSEERYMSIHHSPLSRLAANSVSNVTSRLKRLKQPFDHRDLGITAQRPHFSSDKVYRGRLLFQLSVNTAFVPAATAVADEPGFTLSDEVWSYLSPGVYFTRFVDLKSYNTLDTWRFER